MGKGQLILKAPTALTFWDSNYRSESFIPDSWGNPGVQFHLPGAASTAGTEAVKKEWTGNPASLHQPNCLSPDLFASRCQQLFQDSSLFTGKGL